MTEPMEVLHKLKRAMRPVPGLRRWWPFPLHTQQSLRRIFVECHDALATAIEEKEPLRQVASIIWYDWLGTSGCTALEKSWPAMRALGDLIEDGRLSEKSAAWLATLAQEKPK